MNRHFLEKNQVVAAFAPVSLASGNVTGDWVSLKNYGRCAIIINKGAGNAAEDPTIVLQQASDVAGTGAKALNFDRYDAKVGTQAGIGTFTTTTGNTDNDITDAAWGDGELMLVFDIKAEDLDVDNSFDCINITIADVGTNSQICDGIYILHEPKYAKATLPSAIVD